MLPRRSLAVVLAIAGLLAAPSCSRPFGTVCGDSACSPGENAASCPADCGQPPVCGDGACAGGETAATCPGDCGAFCGNGMCDPNESSATCATDCSGDCGNGTCEPALGESCATCGADCGFCPGDEDDAVTCIDGMDNDADGDTDCADADCTLFCGDSCPNGSCGPGEDCGNCPVDCGMCCGDGACVAGNGESCSTCPADCGSCCGNGFCEAGLSETCSSCAADCGACCGNGFCEAALGETCGTCSQDCGDCCVAAVDVSYTWTDTTVGVAADYFGNSFTAGVTGNMTRLDVLGILDTSGFSTVTVEIYSGGVCGVSTCGPILLAESHAFALGDNYFTLFTPVPVVAGSVYTWRLYTGYGISSSMDFYGLYPGGWCLAYTGYDLNFVTWVDPCP